MGIINIGNFSPSPSQMVSDPIGVISCVPTSDKWVIYSSVRLQVGMTSSDL